jgi:hypothetical protein
MVHGQVASFIIRIYLSDREGTAGKRNWRIKVTHVQEDRETFFETLEEANDYMKMAAGEMGPVQ